MAFLRVLHILHSMNRGGAENAIMNYYRHIDRTKVQFDFLLTEPSKCQFEDEIVSLGGIVYRVPLLKMCNPFPYINEVSSFFDKHPEYKIVHSHTSSKSFFPLWVAKCKGIPNRIAHSHNTKSEHGFKGWIRDLLKFGLKRVATHYFACSMEAAFWLYGSTFWKEGKVMLLRNVIECPTFSFDKYVRAVVRNNLNLNEKSLLVGCVGRFFKQKNLLFAIDVFQEIIKFDENAVFMIVGDGEQRAEIESRIAECGLEDKVLLTGIVSNVSDMLQAMDVFLMPSLFEGLPLSLIEAQTSGLRCVVSDGIPKEADVTGLLTFLPLANGARKWAEMILCQKDYKRRSYKEELKVAGYDAESSAKELEQFYLDLSYSNSD